MSSKAIVSIGTFDGVHLGHQAILNEVRRQADAHRAVALAYAFGLPPRMQANSLPKRTLLLPRSGKDRVILRAIDRVVRASLSQIRHLSPAQFAESILVAQLRARGVVVGESFRFGSRRSGDLDTLRCLGGRLGFTVTAVPPVLMDGLPISSTRIRTLLSKGDTRKAAEMLGRPPILVGQVVHGDKVGRTIGYATANLEPDEHLLLPAHGVYAVHAFVLYASEFSHCPALLYVGTRPTIDNHEEALRCEVHMLTPPDQALYGERIEVHLLERMRGDRQFVSLDALRQQIDLDVGHASELLSQRPPASAPISG